ncbi:MAG: S9 family peptidase, partial [Gemmatimonadota bacterium]
PEPPHGLWRVTVATGAEEKLTPSADYGVRGFEVSDDGLHVAFLGRSTDRYAQPFVSHDVYLFDIRRGRIERLTQNEVGESDLSFSPDNRWFAFTAPDEFQPGRLDRVHLRATAGGAVQKIGGELAWDAAIDFWAPDSKSFYFTSGVGLNTQLFEVRLDRPAPRRISEWSGVAALDYDEDARRVLVRFEDLSRPHDLYLAEIGRLADPRRWVRLTELNPQVASFALGIPEPIQWTSSDGRTVEGILFRPAGYSTTRRYPLVVQIHGGPASAWMRRFPDAWSTYAHVLAGRGYAVLQPNYRGSSNYGERWQMEIAGDYFRQAFDDIMSGVDTAIARGIAHPDSLAMMGWSAGGHWSNWALTHTDRFKAISTGAGAVNWISLYAQTDIQFTREFYFQGMPYGRWEEYWRVSPLQFIQNAKTPTLI